MLIGVSAREGKPVSCRMAVLDGVSLTDLDGAVSAFLSPDAPIRCDNFSAYGPFEKTRGVESVPSSTGPGAYSPSWAHVTVANAKEVLGGTHQGTSSQHLQSYLSEFCRRLSRRFREGELFGRPLRAAISCRPAAA